MLLVRYAWIMQVATTMDIRYTTITKQIYNLYLSSPYSITTPPNCVLRKLNGTTNLPSLINEQ